LVAAGTDHTGASIKFARRTGNDWIPWPTDLGGSTSAGMIVNALAPQPDGTLLVGGQFTIGGGVTTHHAARIPATCPASVPPFGGGCSGSVGPLPLSALSPPWTGSVFRATATTFAAGAFPILVLGWGTLSVPLVQLHPAGGAGCQLLVTNDSSALLFATGGNVNWQLAIPDQPAFVGLILNSQMVQAEFAGRNLP